ncbi:uncharacterized protein LOC115628203 [Scaptodrosophila lebanonensis]|uniref:Uncharacterized protein LOC115628203 n=1 Tax=Drosophila lebanonensis TaxID=7225 RepID=A0A6J2TU06_DROLE|nr:uncharacterized protein LOC115628203 [Scaptodrosophila lebanonensis]
MFVYVFKVHCFDTINDNDLVHVLTSQENVIVLFIKTNCPECMQYEKIISNMKTELKEVLGATVVKAHDSNLVSIYDPAREPALLFFRRGIPLLYYGDIKQDEMMQFFSSNKEPVVKELSDDTFEHLTQSSTGATTGDWFVFFYSDKCISCQRLYAIWESVAAHLKRRLNVARINRMEAGISTAKRFKVVESSSPVFILFRQGNYYQYVKREYSATSLIEFAETGYVKIKPKPVPAMPDTLEQMFLIIFQHINTRLCPAIGIVLIFVILILYFIKRFFIKNIQKDVRKKSK